MNTSNPSAGVYTTEYDQSQRIAAASTSTGVVVGVFDKGPVMERVLITSNQAVISTFGKPNPARSEATYAALQFSTQSSRMYVTRVDNGDALTAGAYLSVDDLSAATPIIKLNNFDDGTNQPLGKYSPFDTLGFDPSTPGIEKVLGFFCAANPGTWNNQIFIRVRPSTKLGATAPVNPLMFYVDVFIDYKSRRQTPDESFLVCRDFVVDGFGEQLQIEEVINRQSNIIRYVPNPYAPLDVNILTTATEYLDGGSNGSIANEGQVVLGWELYRDVESVDVNIMMQAGYDSVAVQQTMVDIAEDRMDSIAVLDIPSNQQEVSDAVYFKRNDLNLSSSYGAIYSPDLQIYDEYNDRLLYVAPSGYVGAVYAKTDNDAATWFAPAGISRGLLSIRGLRHVYNQGDRDALVDAQINPIRRIPDIGYVVWGADTLQVEASALSNVNVRRLMNFLEKSISLAAIYKTFEPNDEILWGQLTEMCDRFLAPIQAGRGLYWYSVVCDDSNNTSDTIAAGDVILDVFVDPVIPAKRIHLRATINKKSQSASFSTSVSDQT